MGKRVVWTGDFNISREEIDTAAAEENMRKNSVDAIEWISTPARRMFNQLLVGGKVHGQRDEGRETSILWDICRSFHEGRRGMYTCWETKVNARPGNYGARIDYVVCSHDMKEWFSDSNIQEGLVGSDHCPVYAILKDVVLVDGEERHILDMVNPPGMFVGGVREQDWSTKCLLPMSGKLIQEFDKRRSIRDMFARTPSLPQGKSSMAEIEANNPAPMPAVAISSAPARDDSATSPTALSRTVSNTSTMSTKPITGKRPAKQADAAPATKRSKTAAPTTPNGLSKGQRSLKGFFTQKTPSVEAPIAEEPTADTKEAEKEEAEVVMDITAAVSIISPTKAPSFEDEAATFATKKTWGKLFSRPVAPKCEHSEPCKTMTTRKPGANCGRSFWMCVRPLGPSGKQEKGSQWRCNTFIWTSEWDTHAAPEPG